MDYLTRYYKNLAENLEEKKNSLLNEIVRQPQQGAVNFIPGPGGRLIPVVDPAANFNLDARANAPATNVGVDDGYMTSSGGYLQSPESMAAGYPANYGAAVPPTPQSLLTPFDPTGRFQPTFSPAPTAPPVAAAAPTAAPFAGRGPMMGKKEQASYDKMVGDMMRARGMAVPLLRSGKGGNYNEWKAAVDARNAAMRDANINITLRQNQMRDQMNTAKANLKAAKEAGDQSAIDQYTQELNGLQTQRRNLNQDTGRFTTNDTTQQLRVAGEQSQASWKRRQDDFKARTGMDYDASNPQHVRVMQNPNMSPEAMQTALSVGAFNKEYSAQNAEHARKFGEADRRFDATGAELNKMRTNPEFRRELAQQDVRNAVESGQIDTFELAAQSQKDVNARKKELERQAQSLSRSAGEKAVEQERENRRQMGIDAGLRAANPLYNVLNPNPPVLQNPNTPEFSLTPDGGLQMQTSTSEFSPKPQAISVAQAQAARENIAGPDDRGPITPGRTSPRTPPEQALPRTQPRPQPAAQPQVNMTGNAINRARSSPNTAIPVQTQTVIPPAAPSEGGMNTPVDLNDFQSNQQQQKQRGGVVTAAARTMGPNRSAAPRLS